MNIILFEKIKKLGDIGDEVTVKSGYARNFLVPNNKALYATPENRKHFEEKKNDIKSHNEMLIKEANEKLKQLSGQEVVLIRAASDTGQLFGSVNNINVQKELADSGVEIDKKAIMISGNNIKQVGKYTAKIRLHREVIFDFTFEVKSINGVISGEL